MERINQLFSWKMTNFYDALTPLNKGRKKLGKPNKLINLSNKFYVLIW